MLQLFSCCQRATLDYSHENGTSNVFKAFSEREDIYYLGGGENMRYLLVYQNEKYEPGISVTDEFDWGESGSFTSS